jgi:hypothetical protein
MGGDRWGDIRKILEKVEGDDYSTGFDAIRSFEKIDATIFYIEVNEQLFHESFIDTLTSVQNVFLTRRLREMRVAKPWRRTRP